jgi:tRNA A37 threonylcarbamoyladenosine synthetase subunit TsaC/SUA5/YrdC
VIAYPTEAVFGLGCNPGDGVAVARLLAIKDRDPAKGLIVIAADPRTAGTLSSPPGGRCCRAGARDLARPRHLAVAGPPGDALVAHR